MVNKLKKQIKSFLLIMLMAMVAMAMLAACGGSEEPDDFSDMENTVEAKEKAPGIGIHHAEIEIQDYGTIKLELNGDEAPLTVQNFMDLANDGFYDGLTFHRIIDGFMIQGGDPEGTGMGGSDKNVVGEFAENGIENSISHKKGVISMARSLEYDSGSSQFFIMVADNTQLDGKYAAFGHVTEGQEIADKIAADAEPTDNNGTIPPEAQPVITKITIID